MPVRIGTSGWQYRHWSGTFYPRDLPTSGWLGSYAGCFDTVEVDSAFSRLPASEVVEHWRDESPDGFVMAVKSRPQRPSSARSLARRLERNCALISSTSAGRSPCPPGLATRRFS